MGFLLLAPNGIPDSAQLRLALRERLPANMVPAHFEAVASFPQLAASGKIDRHALKAVPLTAAAAAAALEQDEPETETEAALLDAARKIFPDQ